MSRASRRPAPAATIPAEDVAAAAELLERARQENARRAALDIRAAVMAAGDGVIDGELRAISALHAAVHGTNDTYGDALVMQWRGMERELSTRPPLTARDFTRKLAAFVRHLVHAQTELEPGVARSAALLLADAITLETGPITAPALPAEAFVPDDYTANA